MSLESITAETPSYRFSSGSSVRNPEIFARLPPKSKWTHSGLVERQTVSTDVSWQSRMMVMTTDTIYFAKPDSDLVLDQFALKLVSFIGKVDKAQNALVEASKLNSGTAERDSKRSSGRRGSVKFSSTLKVDSIVDLQEGIKDTHTFEVRLSTATDESSAISDRSYFARVDSAEQCEQVSFGPVHSCKRACAFASMSAAPNARVRGPQWIADIKAAAKRVRARRAQTLF